ncbi:MAG: DUF4974 domain-containing protein [Prolixibacteraceae bacterium]|nr:DUF4974 domain-containing protein [Prolixibacteraceae bacterium]
MKKKVEDILVEEEITAKKIRETDASPKVLNAAAQLYAYLRIPRHSWSVWEKKQLKSQIQSSIETIARRRIRRIWLAAASVLVFVASGGIWYIQLTRHSNIAEFANSIHENKNDTITRLVLSESREVEISEVESDILYDTKGEQIAIGASKKIQQKLETVEPIYNTLTVPYGKRAKITLSEGTMVWLNSGSKMVYPAVFAANMREVYIDGEAIFNVSKDTEKPFVVKSHQFDIEVIGTVFNINAYSNDKISSAVLEQGVIKLIRQTKVYLPAENMIMSPGEMVTYNPKDEKFQIQKVDPSDYLSWHYGYYVFRSETLGNILKRLSRYYNVEIDLKNKELALVTFSGSLDLKNSPEEVLNTIKKTVSLNFNKEGQIINIY